MKGKLNPHISVDCVIFGFDSKSLKVLLVEREFRKPVNGRILHDLKLPGSLVYENENLHSAADRVLKELTGLDHIFLEQFAVFDSPQRTKNRIDKAWLQATTGIKVGRILTVAYYSLIQFERASQLLSRLKRKARWINLNDLGHLPFDHNEIIKKGQEYLRNKIRTEPIALELLPKKFTLRQLQDLYEVLLSTSMDNRNFRKKLLRLGYFIPLEEKEKDVAHKPARLYRFDWNKYESVRKETIVFSI